MYLSVCPISHCPISHNRVSFSYFSLSLISLSFLSHCPMPYNHFSLIVLFLIVLFLIALFSLVIYLIVQFLMILVLTVLSHFMHLLYFFLDLCSTRSKWKRATTRSGFKCGTKSERCWRNWRMLFCWCIISCRIWSCSTSSPLTRMPWLGSRSSRRLVFRKVTSVRFISQHWRRKSKYLWISFSWNDKLLCRSLPRSLPRTFMLILLLW